MVSGVNFCVDELLWMLTWGWYQLGFSICLSWLAYVFFGKLKMAPALALATGSYGFSIFVYFSFVTGIFLHCLQFSAASPLPSMVYSPFWASLVLGCIYSVLQLIFFGLINYWRTLPIQLFFGLSFICNIAAACLASYFIRVTF